MLNFFATHASSLSKPLAPPFASLILRVGNIGRHGFHAAPWQRCAPSFFFNGRGLPVEFASFCSDAPVPRVVVIDTRGIWVFAEWGAKCNNGGQSNVPAEIMKFSGDGRLPAVFQQPFHLFYIDRVAEEFTYFVEPKLVSERDDWPPVQAQKVIKPSMLHYPDSRSYFLELADTELPLASRDGLHLKCIFERNDDANRYAQGSAAGKLLRCDAPAITNAVAPK